MGYNGEKLVAGELVLFDAGKGSVVTEGRVKDGENATEMKRDSRGKQKINSMYQSKEAEMHSNMPL